MASEWDVHDAEVDAERYRANNPLGPVGFEELDVSTAVVRLVSIPDHARSATVQVQTAALRLTFDGRAPTASVGTRFDANDILNLKGRAALQGLQAVREGGTDAHLTVTFWE